MKKLAEATALALPLLSAHLVNAQSSTAASSAPSAQRTAAVAKPRYSKTSPTGISAAVAAKALGRELEKFLDGALAKCPEKPPKAQSPIPDELYKNVNTLWRPVIEPPNTGWGSEVQPTELFAHVYASGDPRLAMDGRNRSSMRVAVPISFAQANSFTFRVSCLDQLAASAKATVNFTVNVDTAAKLESTAQVSAVIRIGTYKSELAGLLSDSRPWSERSAAYEGFLLWFDRNPGYTGGFYVDSVETAHLVSSTSDTQAAEALVSLSFSYGAFGSSNDLKVARKAEIDTRVTRTFVLGSPDNPRSDTPTIVPSGVTLLALPHMTKFTTEVGSHLKIASAIGRGAKLSFRWGSVNPIALALSYDKVPVGADLCNSFTRARVTWNPGSATATSQDAAVTMTTPQPDGRCNVEIDVPPVWDGALQNQEAQLQISLTTTGGKLTKTWSSSALIEADHSAFYGAIPNCGLSAQSGRVSCSFNVIVTGPIGKDPKLSPDLFRCDGNDIVAQAGGIVWRGNAGAIRKGDASLAFAAPTSSMRSILCDFAGTFQQSLQGTQDQVRFERTQFMIPIPQASAAPTTATSSAPSTPPAQTTP